jgi:methionine aminopeptidase
LKTKSARVFYNEVIKKYPTLCFSMRSFEDEITAKLGVKECLEHDLLNSYPVLVEKSGEIVAQFKYTIMILQGGTVAITGLPLD